MAGTEVLKQLKNDPQYNQVPDAICSDTKEDKVMLIYSNGVNSFIQKPNSRSEFESLISAAI